MADQLLSSYEQSYSAPANLVRMAVQVVIMVSSCWHGIVPTELEVEAQKSPGGEGEGIFAVPEECLAAGWTADNGRLVVYS
jgi:hypothetical protein